MLCRSDGPKIKEILIDSKKKQKNFKAAVLSSNRCSWRFKEALGCHLMVFKTDHFQTTYGPTPAVSEIAGVQSLQPQKWGCPRPYIYMSLYMFNIRTPRLPPMAAPGNLRGHFHSRPETFLKDQTWFKSWIMCIWIHYLWDTRLYRWRCDRLSLSNPNAKKIWKCNQTYLRALPLRDR